MNKIIIGSIVLCKLMILEPQNKMTTVESISGTSTSQGATGNQILDQFNVLEKKTIEQKSKEIEKDGDHIAIVGEVQEIRSVTKYLKNSETGKYKRTQHDMLVVKSDKIDKLFIEPRSCGLADDLLEREQTEEEKKIVAENNKKKAENKKTAQKPKAATTDNKALSKAKVGEYIVVPADTELGSDFEVVTDEKLQKEIMQAIQQNEKTKDNKKENVVSEEKNLEEKLYENQTATFSTEKIVEKKEIAEVKIETPKEEIKETVPVSDLEMFDFFGNETKKEIKKIEPVKKMEVAKKKEIKTSKPKIEKQQVKDEISSEEKSILSEALDIAF